MNGPIEELSDEGQFRSNAEMVLNQMDTASAFNGDIEKYMIEQV